MQSAKYLNQRGLLTQRTWSEAWCFLLVFLMLALAPTVSQAQSVLNVTNYNAKGDAVQFYVNTVSNSVVVTTTNHFSSADVGKTIEIFGVGKSTYGVNSYGVTTNGNQDLIAKVVNVMNATNIYLSILPQVSTNYPPPQKTATGVFAIMGTDNTPAFARAIAAAASYTNATIYIPNGTYLLMPVLRHNADGYAFGSIIVRRGGLHFLGQSEAKTVLLSRGAWQSLPGSSYPFRGFLFEIVAPITNDYPLIFDNMTWNGGVRQGNLRVHGIQCNRVDGLGWDEQHSAYLTFDSGNNTGTATHQILTNLTVIHWRGEMIKSIDGNTNGNITISHCLFGDGCATALNVYPAWNVRNNTFSNLFQIAELYQKYYSRPGYFCNNFATNITANGFAFNGGWSGAKPFTMESNVFYFSGIGFNAILTTPGVNISIVNNQIHCANYMTVFDIGAPGAQGYVMNSNILISGNSIYAPSKISRLITFGGGGINGVNGLTISSNYVSVPNQIFNVFQVGGNQTNVSIYDNTIVCPMTSMSLGAVGSGNSPFVLLPANNTYTAFPQYVSSPQTNLVCYTSGPRQRMDYVATGSTFVLDDSESNQIPAGAYFDFDNRSNRWASLKAKTGGGDGSVIIYPSKRMVSPLKLPFGQQMFFYWNGSAWTTNAPNSSVSSGGSSSRPAPPAAFRVMN